MTKPRACGDCTLCCKVLGIRELNKPENEYCPHCAIGSGCTIYKERPPSCVAFECVWLQDEKGYLGRELRPDKCHVVMFAPGGKKHVEAHVDPKFPGAWKRPVINRLLIQTSYKNPVAMVIGDRHYEINHGVVREIRVAPPDENGFRLALGYVGEPAAM